MNSRTVTSNSFIVCVVFIIGVTSNSLEKTTLRSFVTGTVPTDLTTKFPVIASSESRVSNSYGKAFNDLEDSEEESVEGAPPDHIVPHSDHENPEEPSTRSKNTDQPGDWSKAPPAVKLNFVPTKMYAQVRNTHTVKHLPREDALKSATTDEEILAAPRLREVVSKSKKNTIYTEEGYEDAAYDHAGHVRDANYHEGYAKKLDDQRKIKDNVDKKNPEVEEINLDDDEESNNYDDDYRDHVEDSSTVGEFRNPKVRDSKEREKYKGLKSLWQDSSINPKQVAENEIDKLEEVLENEYEESERNTENQVPENLKKPSDDYEEEENEPSGEDDVTSEHDDEMSVDEENNESREYSREYLKNPRLIESRKNDIPDDSSSSHEEIKGISMSVDPSVDYGKIFWDYFKSVGNNSQPQELSSPKEITSTLKTINKLNDKELTSIPSSVSTRTTIKNFDTTSSPSRPDFRDFSSTSEIDNEYPLESAIYDSWKRHDRSKNLEEIPEENSDLSDSFEKKYRKIKDPEEISESEKNSSMSVQNVDTSQTLIGPKKLSYTVIFRPGEKTTAKNPPCDRKDNVKSGETNSIVKAARPRYGEMSNNSRDQWAPVGINNFSMMNDLTVIRPPLPVPLGQVTFADFMPVSYASVARPSVTRVNGGYVEESNDSHRDRYQLPKNIHDYRGQNSHVRYHPLQGRKTHLYNVFPVTKLVPPSPINTSQYAEYSGVKRVGKPRPRFDSSSSLNPLPGIMQFTRTMDRTIFGRRRRSVNNGESEEKNAASNDNGTVGVPRVDTLEEKKLLPERNFIRYADRLVVDDNTQAKKSNGLVTRKRRNDEELLNESPRIADEEINAEIESRFKDEDAEEKELDDDEKRDKIAIDIPDFDFSEVIENKKSEKVMKNQPMKADWLDLEKYPFYENSKISRSSVLKYITNPRKVPRKTLGGTEFYDSRDRYRECDEVEPNLESVLPEEEQPSEDQEPHGDQPRLHGLGDKLDCLRAKYFDDNPLDNPLFLEKRVGQPRVPEELDALKSTIKIFKIPNDEDERPVIRRVSRKPEFDDLRNSGSYKNQFSRNEAQPKHRITDADPRSIKFRRNHSNREMPERRRRERKLVRATTETPELPVMPYESEVYEDVMGTINNLAGLYQTFEKPVSSESIQPTSNHPLTIPRENTVHHPTIHITERPRGFLISPSHQPTSNHPLTTPRENTFDYPTIHITERPRGFMMSPSHQVSTVQSPKLQRYRIIPYRTNKVSYRLRTRTENSPGQRDARIGYFRTVKVHKRSVSNEKMLFDLEPEETRNMATIRTRNASNDVSSIGRAKKLENKEIPADLTRVVYTIRDRIRHSKPRGISGRHGKLTNPEVAESVDMRRREPRYNRMRSIKVDSKPSTTVRWKDPEEESEEEHNEELKEVPEEPVSSPKSLPPRDTISGRHEYHDEPDEMYKIQYSTTRGKKIDPSNLERRNEDENSSSEDYDEEMELNEGEAKQKRQKNHYDVHENLEDDVTTIPSVIEPTKSPEFFELQKYLQSDPPGYSEAFDEKSTESSSRYSQDEEPTRSNESAEVKIKPKEDSEEEGEEEEEKEEDEDDEGEERQVERPSASYVDEESSSKSEEDEDSPDSIERSESYKNAEEDDKDDDEDEEDEEEEHSPQVEDASTRVEDSEKEFDRFVSRPYSPFESYEDPKYMDLGPRLSKPLFHHPSFSTVKHGGKPKYSKESDNDESNESDEEKSSYVFPWHADEDDDEEDAEKDAEESKDSDYKIERYEYPWERRERLARERRRKAKRREEHRSLYGFSDDAEDEDDSDEDEDGANTQLLRRRVYPWDYYKVPSKKSRRGKATRRTIDNEEMSSNDRPRFSSRYKTKSFDFDENDPKVVAGAPNPGEMKISVMKSIEKAFKDEAKEPTDMLKNILQSNATTNSTISTSTFAPRRSTMASRRTIKWNTPNASSTTPTATVRSTGNLRKMRIWRTTSSTTVKPKTRKRQDGIVNEPRESASQKSQVLIKPTEKMDRNTTEVNSSGFNRKIRRRGSSTNRSTTTTSRPVIRRRLRKMTPRHENDKESTIKSITEKNTTPKVKTIEHRSRFSKEEIITKTSYPGLNNNNNNNSNEREYDEELDSLERKHGNGSSMMMNESIKKISIMTKETPEHIYRMEEIDNDGVKGKFVMITPNNGTNSTFSTNVNPEDRSIHHEETRKMLKRFEDSAESNEDDAPEFTRDSNLMANLMRQVPPFTNDFSSDESSRERKDFFDPEGSGSSEDEENNSSTKIPTDWVKNPDERLYYYVEE